MIDQMTVLFLVGFAMVSGFWMGTLYEASKDLSKRIKESTLRIKEQKGC